MKNIMADVQVFGCNGMLGTAVCQALEYQGMTVLRDVSNILDAPSRIAAPLVINCAGIVKQRKVHTNRFFLVNGAGPRLLELACNQVGSRLIHISTDCVFDGKEGPYFETDKPNAVDIYGLSKAVGEVISYPHVTIRTSFVGCGKRGLVANMVETGQIHASANFLWSGHTVETVANVIAAITQSSVYGIFHIPGDFITRLDLVTMIKNALNLDIEIIRDDSFMMDRRLAQTWPHPVTLGLPSIQEQLAKWNAQ